MAKDPAFLFYPNDWLGGTMGMSFEEKGAYMDLLVLQWNRGRISEVEASRITSPTLWGILKNKFTQDSSGFFNGRLEKEISKRKAFSETQTQKANVRWGKSGNAGALPIIENRNENENRNEIHGVPGNFRISIKPKYLHDKVVIIHDLQKYFESTTQIDQLRIAGKNHFTEFMSANPGAMYNDPNHLYRAFLKFSPSSGSGHTNQYKIQ